MISVNHLSLHLNSYECNIIRREESILEFLHNSLIRNVIVLSYPRFIS